MSRVSSLLHARGAVFHARQGKGGPGCRLSERGMKTPRAGRRPLEMSETRKIRLHKLRVYETEATPLAQSFEYGI